MIKYTEATKRPYGYLFIDLKQNTPEEERLKIDIFNDHITDTSSLNGMIGGGNTEYTNDQAKTLISLKIDVEGNRHFQKTCLTLQKKGCLSVMNAD
jgi:hypothetical protein